MKFGKLEKFITKRVLILFSILTILNSVFLNNKLLFFIGLTLGSVLSLFRFFVMDSALTGILILKNGFGNKKAAIKYIFSLLVTLIFLLIAAIINKWVMLGMMAGILIVPLVVMLNSITEGLKITHNNFE